MSYKTTEKQNSRKFNWGAGLTIVILVFIVGTLGMVGFIISLDFHMVTDNHYEKAVNYQEHIDRVEQAGALESPVDIVLLPGEGEIQIVFPSSLTHNDPSGVIELYRPNDSAQDQKSELRLNDKGIHRISIENMAKGKWLVKVTWVSGERQFYQQKPVFL